MMVAISTRSGGGWSALLWGTLALGCLAAPDTMRNRLQSIMANALAPGLGVFRSAEFTLEASWNDWKSAWQNTEHSPVADSRLDQALLRIRQLELANADLMKQVKLARHQGPELYRADASAPLFIPQMIQARIVGRQSGAKSVADLLLNIGSEQGAIESAWVVEAKRPLIDQGEQNAVRPGHSVYAGTVVVGRVIRAGKWMSTIQHVTDPEYRGHAQIIRPAGDHMILGAEGKIAGTGQDTCLLQEIPATESVSVGDRVYTASQSEAVRFPLYYGVITKAELPVGADTWRIEVEPALSLDDVRQVSVLRENVNPQRLLAH